MWKIMLIYSRFNIFNVWFAFEHKYGFGADAYACIAKYSNLIICLPI